jgi:predicted DNA-binding WGR domain protein
MPKTTSKRRFEFVGGNSDKFWEVQMAGKEVTVRFGRNGADGQTNTKAFPDAAAASMHADKLVRAKLRKGYVEIG